jgi:hypothetical protein
MVTHAGTGIPVLIAAKDPAAVRLDGRRRIAGSKGAHMKRWFLLAAITASITAAATVSAHHGWSEYDADKPLQLSGTIQEAAYVQPHGWIRLKSGDKLWVVVLAPPARMESRGLGKDMLKVGGTASVYGYPHRTKREEMRAERITIGGKTTELR